MATITLEPFLKNIDSVIIVRCLLLVFIGIPIIYTIAGIIAKYFTKTYSAQMGMIVGKGIRYIAFAVIILTVLHEFGFSLSPLLGAAGIFGLAIGFASQTTISNVISGIFLIAERPFAVDDVIQVGNGNTIGQVLSIDILSIKIRTFDNKFVRIPNETILKSEVTNITYFPVRRLDIPVKISYKENLAKVRSILQEVALQNPLCLNEPEPMIRIDAFGNSSYEITIAVWTEKQEFLKLKNSLHEEIKSRLDKEGIELALPHIAVYKGAASEAFQVKLVDDRAEEV